MRRTEDTTYAPWCAILQALIKDYTDVFLICPQYNIYVSRLQSSSMPTQDASFRTKADGEARGVYADFAVLKPVMKLSNISVSTIHQFLANISILSLPFQNIWISEETEVPILVELKPPPTRHPRNLCIFLRELSKVLEQAQFQAMDQAHCLMCSPKFALQDAVIVIIGVGEWWTCRIVTRSHAAKLGLYDELNVLGLDSDDEGEIEEDGIKFDLFDTLVHPNQARNARVLAEKRLKEHQDAKAVEEAERAAVIEMQNHERTLRLENRNIRSNNRNDAEAISLYARYPYCAETINQYWNLTHGEPYMVDDADTTALDNIRALSESSWSLPMRLGSKASARYMALVGAQLQELSSEEYKRRAG